MAVSGGGKNMDVFEVQVQSDLEKIITVAQSIDGAMDR